jgi:hypothetical protein
VLAPSELALILLGQLRLVLVLPLALFAPGLAWITYGTPHFRAKSRVRVSLADGGVSRIAGIAAQFGVALPGGSGAYDPVEL